MWLDRGLANTVIAQKVVGCGQMMLSTLRRETKALSLTRGLWPVRRTIRFMPDLGAFRIERSLGKARIIPAHDIVALKYARRTRWYSEFLVTRWQLAGVAMTGPEVLLLTTLSYDQAIAVFVRTSNEEVRPHGGPSICGTSKCVLKSFT